MSTIGSVSKGVFVFKGKKKSAIKADYLDTGNDQWTVKERFNQYEELWECFDLKIKILQSDLNTKIFEDLVTFVAKAQQGFKLNTGLSNYILQEMPTAALITGVNMPDHDAMFTNLSSLLKEKVSPHIAVLKSKDCPNIKNILLNAIGQIMLNIDMLDDEDDVNTTGNRKTNHNTTLSSLAAWYKHKYKRSSPKKRKLTGKIVSQEGSIDYPPVVIVFEDLEAFPPHVLQDFITICCNHLCDIPFVMIFGIATNVTAVHRLMPHAVSSLLSMEKFQAPPATEYLSQVIDQLIITSDNVFKLGSKVFSLLLDLFLYHDFSVMNFVRSYQFCLLDHFYSNPLSVLCCNVDGAKGQLNNLRKGQISLIRNLPSFLRHVEQSREKEQKQLLENDKHLKKVIEGFLVNLDEYHQSFFPLLRCLHSLANRLPGYPMGKHLRELYLTSLCEDICDSQDYKEASMLLRSFSRDELVSALSYCVEILSKEELPRNLKEIADKLQAVIERLNNIEELSKEYRETCNEEEDKETVLPKKTDMYTLRKKLQEMKKKKMTVFEVLRNETIDLLDATFRKYITCPQKLPLHEIFYYNDACNVRRQINGSPRATIQTALSKPYAYIQNEGCKTDTDVIPATLPDICIVYKLHLECGRLINLFDWLQAFIAIVNPETEHMKADTAQALQARFIRAVSELQFLGFIKPTKRKTDHVARLTWGGC